MERDCEDRNGNMSADFLDYLRERGTAGVCAHHCGGHCDLEESIRRELFDIVPVKTFECDRDAPAERCSHWTPESDWAGSWRRSYQMDCEETASARKHQMDVAAHKGFEVVA